MCNSSALLSVLSLRIQCGPGSQPQLLSSCLPYLMAYILFNCEQKSDLHPLSGFCSVLEIRGRSLWLNTVQNLSAFGLAVECSVSIV